MNMSRRDFLSAAADGCVAIALSGCAVRPPRPVAARLALQLRSIRGYVVGRRDRDGRELAPGAGLAKAFRALSAVGYRGVEFEDNYGNDAKTLRMMLDDNGLTACGAHYGMNAFLPEHLDATCDFNLGFGNNLLVYADDGRSLAANAGADEALRSLADRFNGAAAQAARCGCRVALRVGSPGWEALLALVDPAVCLELDVAAVCAAGVDPRDLYEMYPHRSPTLCARPDGCVDWASLVPATETDGVGWYVVECDDCAPGLSAVLPAYDFFSRQGVG